MPRSGSTLTEQILASHPQVHAAGELTYLDRMVLDSLSERKPAGQFVFRRSVQHVRCRGPADDWARLIWPSLPPVADGKVRITDKLPMNFLYVGLIHLILPNARIIHTMRDPVDTCVSCFSRLFTNLPFSYDLAELGRYYRSHHELMAHWRSVLPAGAMLDVVYEDVVDNLEEQARRLIDYCGLPWDDRCLSFHADRPDDFYRQQRSSPPATLPRLRSSAQRAMRLTLQPLLAELEGCRSSD